MDAARALVPLRLLVIEDNDDDAELLRLALRGTSFHLERAATLKAGLALLKAGFDVVLLDLSLPDSDGIAGLEAVLESSEKEAVVVLTGYDNEELGVRMVQAGAQDYLVKGHIPGALLARTLRYAMERKRLVDVAACYREELRRKNAQLEEDLDLAREMQRTLLPRDAPDFTAQHGASHRPLSLCHRYAPIGAVGGDFLSVTKASEDVAGIMMCDVMGHGVRAALVTAILRALLLESRAVGTDPVEALKVLNGGLRDILKDSDSVMFVSAVYLAVDIRRGVVTYANAGHPSPLHVPRAGPPTMLPLKARGAALGLLDSPEYTAQQFPLAPGDGLLLFTDGLYEVGSSSGDVFGEGRLFEAVGSRAAMPPDALLDGVLADARAFAGREQLDDDASLLWLRWQ